MNKNSSSCLSYVYQMTKMAIFILMFVFVTLPFWMKYFSCSYLVMKLHKLRILLLKKSDIISTTLNELYKCFFAINEPEKIWYLMLNRHNSLWSMSFMLLYNGCVFYVSVLRSVKDATSATRCFLLVTNLESYFFLLTDNFFVKRQSFNREKTYSNIYITYTSKCSEVKELE